MTRPVPPCAVDFILKVEGSRLKAYQDSGGVWTIGAGHTPAHEGQVITEAEEHAFLMADLGIAAERLARDVNTPELASLTENEYAALLSFVFNVGAAPGCTIWSVLDANNLAGVPAQMLQFDKAHVGGKLVVVPGLLNRRKAEVALWNSPAP